MGQFAVYLWSAIEHYFTSQNDSRGEKRILCLVYYSAIQEI